MMASARDSLPPLYLRQMANLLGAEFEEFAAIYDMPAQAGLRLNPAKIERETFLQRFPLALSPVAWCPDGFHLPQDPEVRAGKHPYHAAGLYYLQDPASMAAVEILAPRPGEIILDVAAAPGGKATHLASALQNQGFLVANEIHPRRAWDLAENLERWGTTHAAITNATTQQLAEQLPEFFDRVLVDAPCSGEALFRRYPGAQREWSPEAVQACSRRQEDLLEAAGQLVKPGGSLLYATCTFNPTENEQVIEKFLDAHPDYQPGSPPDLPGLSPGMETRLAGKQSAQLPEAGEPVSQEPTRGQRGTRRIWPHKSAGEGHFFALLQKKDNGRGSSSRRLGGFTHRPLPKDLAVHFRQFSESTLVPNDLPGHLHLEGSYLYLIQEDCPPLDGLRTIHPGLWLGTFKKNRFEPAHALALAQQPDQVQRTCQLQTGDPQLEKFLRGETIHSPGEGGWLLVCVEEFPLGWGKRVGNQVKSHFPRGLRWT